MRHLIASAQHRTFALVEVRYVEGDDLDANRKDVDCLACDEGKECRVVSHSNAAVDPGAVVVIALNAPATHIAVIASRHRHNIAFKTELMDWESLQQLRLRDAIVAIDKARA